MTGSHLAELHRSELSFLLLGKKLGEGVSRSVYALNDPAEWAHRPRSKGLTNLSSNSRFVIKVEQPGGMHQNVQEWTLWHWLAHDKTMSKWFAPCAAISPCGLYLIQRRAQPLRTKELPKRLPEFLVDAHRDNLGLIDGRVVCCDYGTGVAAIRTASRRMVKVEF